MTQRCTRSRAATVPTEERDLDEGFMLRALKRLLAFLGLWSGHQPPGAERDPYARRPVPRKPQPKARSGAVAVVEPDE